MEIGDGTSSSRIRIKSTLSCLRSQFLNRGFTSFDLTIYYICVTVRLNCFQKFVASPRLQLLDQVAKFDANGAFFKM